MDLLPGSRLTSAQRCLPGVVRFYITWGINLEKEMTLGEAAKATPLGWELFSCVLSDWLTALPPSSLAPPWRERTLLSLIRHILFRHHSYLRLLMERVEGCWEEQGKAPLSSGSEKLGVRYRHLMADLEAHMTREETTLFPLVMEAEEIRNRGQMPAKLPRGLVHPLRILRWEHNTRGDELTGIRTMMVEMAQHKMEGVSVLPACAGLRELEADLSLHSYLEDEVLFKRLEDDNDLT